MTPLELQEKIREIKHADLPTNEKSKSVTNNLFVTFDDPTGAVVQGCLFVQRASGGNSTTICNNCTTSSSATLVCSLGSTSADYSWSFYIKENPILVILSGWAMTTCWIFP